MGQSASNKFSEPRLKKEAADRTKAKYMIDAIDRYRARLVVDSDESQIEDKTGLAEGVISVPITNQVQFPSPEDYAGLAEGVISVPITNQVQFPSPEDYEREWENISSTQTSPKRIRSLLAPVFREIFRLKDGSLVEAYEERNGIVTIAVEQGISDERFQDLEASIRKKFHMYGIHDVELVFEKCPRTWAQHQSGNKVVACGTVSHGGEKHRVPGSTSYSVRSGEALFEPRTGASATIGLMLRTKNIREYPPDLMFVTTVAHLNDFTVLESEQSRYKHGRAYIGDCFLCSGRPHQDQHCPFHGADIDRSQPITCGLAGDHPNSSIAKFEPRSCGAMASPVGDFTVAIDVMVIPMSSPSDLAQAVKAVHEGHLMEVEIFSMPWAELSHVSMTERLGSNKKIAVYFNSHEGVIMGEITEPLDNRRIHMSDLSHVYNGVMQYRLDERRSANGEMSRPQPRSGDSGSPVLWIEKGIVRVIGLHVAFGNGFCHAVFAEPNLQAVWPGEIRLYMPAEVLHQLNNHLI